MANIKFTNFARTALAVGVGSGDVTMSVTGGTGALFPALTAGQYFYAVLENAALDREIVKVTARSTDTLTVTRGQDNTTARAWVAGDIVSLRLNAAAIEEAVVGTLLVANNLSDVADAAVARANLGAQATGSYAASGVNADITSLTALTAGGLPNNSVLTADIADAQITPAKLSQPSTLGTSVATTSGTSHDFTGIPSWVKKITVMFSVVSTNGTSPIQVQIGAGSVSNSGYVGTAGGVTNTGNVMGVTSFTTGFGVVHAFGASNQTVSGSLVLTLLNSATGTWSASGTVSQAPGSFTGISTSGGATTLSGVLDRVRITTVNGTDAFDAGSCNILYE